VREIK